MSNFAEVLVSDLPCSVKTTPSTSLTDEEKVFVDSISYMFTTTDEDLSSIESTFHHILATLDMVYRDDPERKAAIEGHTTYFHDITKKIQNSLREELMKTSAVARTMCKMAEIVGYKPSGVLLGICDKANVADCLENVLSWDST
ncbi:hypothetical protein F66182_10186 [Fusarium sp. NRRL 66182]|nr:hypothetical protein F66182_10186 [Fusarium sp. NRRL 66182]